MVIRKQYRVWLMPLMVLLMAFQLAACGDSEGEKQKALIDYLHNTVMRGGEQAPTLSEDQKQRFGVYAIEYQALLSFSQKRESAVQTALVPVMTLLTQIQEPEDYLRKQDDLAQALGTLSVMEQQIRADLTQLDNTMAAMKYPEALKSAYQQVYQKIARQPTEAILTLTPELISLAQDVVQVGTLLQEQQKSVKFNGTGVQLATPEAVEQYNRLMSAIRSKQAVLPKVKQSILSRLEP